MKLCICVNHAQPFHVGGSEKVVQQISESMTSDFGFECHILTKFCSASIVYNGVNIHKVAMTPNKFFDQVKKIDPDHILVYSDYFQHWKSIVLGASKIRASKSVSLVGMNAMNSDQNLKNTFVRTHKNFSCITHSEDYMDYKFCKAHKIPVSVINNGISLEEFDNKEFSFRDKYSIDTEHIILCVSNFFPGKGQEHLYFILEQLAKERSDFTAIFVANRVSFNVANNIMVRFQRFLKKAKFKNRLMMNLPREDVLQSFKESSVFAFPSQQEVSPLVILEAMAVGCPWVGLPVGNLNSLEGGMVVPAGDKIAGQYKYSSSMYNKFAQNINKILNDKDYRDFLSKKGKEHIINFHNWNNLKYQYKKVFEGVRP